MTKEGRHSVESSMLSISFNGISESIDEFRLDTGCGNQRFKGYALANDDADDDNNDNNSNDQHNVNDDTNDDEHDYIKDNMNPLR